MKNIFSNRLRRFAAAIIFAGGLVLPVMEAEAQLPDISIVYPRPGQLVGAVDSTFILGHLPDDLPCKPKDVTIDVNGHRFDVHPDGGFIAWVPVTPGLFTFHVTAHCKDELERGGYEAAIGQAVAIVTVRIPEPLLQVPVDSLIIIGDYKRPSGDLTLNDGDMLEVAFQGTPGVKAWFSIPGVVDSVPMAETPPRLQAYWGESVFGAGSVPDSLLVRGIYSGQYRIPDSVSATDVNIEYHLAPPEKHRVLLSAVTDRFGEVREQFRRYMRMPSRMSLSSGYQVSINSSDFPFTVRFADSVQIIRLGPRKGYLSIFQPQGVEALAVGAEGDWYKLQLSRNRYAWCNRESVERLPKGITPPASYLRSIRTYSTDESVTIEFPLSGKHAFRIIEDDRRHIRVRLYGVTSDTDWIRYDFSDSLIDLATWTQPEDDLYELRLMLTQDIWGYDSYYSGNTLRVVLNRPPVETWRLRGKTIVIDPGHSQDPGAVGPTRLTEAEANLGIALVVRHMLKSAGAEVIMTRDDNSHVPLYDRPTIAKLNDADLFVSIHNNALPDGVNPFVNHGTSTYYYHPHSIDLAKAIQHEMIAIAGLQDHGLYYGNLAVNRPTQYPAVLVECAFMILPEQEALLKTKRFRRRVATAIVNGIQAFLEGYNDGR